MVLTWWQVFPLLALGAYTMLCLVVIVKQDRLLYFPEPLTQDEAHKAFAFCRVEPWPEGSGVAHRGLMKETVPEACLTNGTVLVFHGNAGGAHQRGYFCDTLQKLGWRVILAEYPGYAARPGKRGERSFSEDGRVTARLVRQKYPGPLVILGESLGSGVAASVASDPELKAEAVVLAVPWNTLTTVAAHHYPWLPVRLFLKDSYDSVAYLQRYDGSVSVVQAEDDEIIPAASTRALFDGLPHGCRKRLINIPLAGHNEWFYNVTEAQWRMILSSTLSP